MRDAEFTIGFRNVARLYPDQVPASLAQRERIILYAIVYGIAPSHSLELGTFRGGSAAIISGALDDLELSGRLLCVEPNIDGIDSEIKSMTAHNTTIAEGLFPNDLPAEFEGKSTKELFEFCFYDADHTYEGVRDHLKIIPQFMRPGAFIICHDGYNHYQARGIREGSFAAGLIDCGMLTRCANEFSDADQLYGGMRLLKVPGELHVNSY